MGKRATVSRRQAEMCKGWPKAAEGFVALELVNSLLAGSSVLLTGLSYAGK